MQTDLADTDLADEVVSLALHLISVAVPCHGIGIRLRDRNGVGTSGPFPLAGQVGFSGSFVQVADRCHHSPELGLRCLCGGVLSSRSTCVPLTASGSFFSPVFNAETFAAALSNGQEGCACLDEGVASMMLVPMRNDEDVIGLLLAANREAGAFDLAALARLERIALGLLRLLTKVRELSSQHGAGSFRVLIAEDDPQVQGMMVRMLDRIGYHCTAVNDGLKAYEMIQSERYDLLVTDLDMPRMGGLELIKRIREHYGPYGPPIIVSSGSAALASLNAEQLQVAAILAKPLASLHDLQDVVAKVLTTS